SLPGRRPHFLRTPARLNPDTAGRRHQTCADCPDSADWIQERPGGMKRRSLRPCGLLLLLSLAAPASAAGQLPARLLRAATSDPAPDSDRAGTFDRADHQHRADRADHDVDHADREGSAERTTPTERA